MESPTLDGLLKEVDIPLTLLDQKCSDEHLNSISLFLDWRRTAPHLGLSETDIKEIEADEKTDSEKRFKTLQKWKSKYGYLAKIKSLVQVLLKVGNADHAERVCRLLQPQVHTGDSLGSEAATASPSSSDQPQSNQAASVKPTKQPSSTTVQVASITSKSLEQKIEKEIQDLEDQFFTVVYKAQSDLQNVDLSMVKLCIMQLPVSLKHQHIKFLQENLSAIESAHSIGEIFSILSLYWDFLNCGLLQELVRRLGKGELKQLMEQYTEKLREFRMNTKLEDFICKWARNCPCDFSEFITKMGDDWRDRTLEDLEKFRIELARKMYVKDYTLYCTRIKPGSVSVTWALPRALPGIADALQSIFSLLEEDYDVTVVVFQGKYIRSKLSDEASLEVEGSSGYIDLMCSQLQPRATFKELLEGLIQNSRDVRAVGEHEMTALHYSVLNKDESCTKALIVFGADINARNKYDQTPLDIALQNQVDDLVPLLVSVGGKRSEDIIQSSGSPSGLLKARAEIVSPSPLSKHIHSEEAKFLTSGASEAEGGSRILSLDGGGIRGLVEIEILSEIERLTGKKITDIFDIIIGTSTGGIVALGLVYCNMTLSHLRQLYFRLSEEVFANSRMSVAYNSIALDDFLKKEMGTELKMSDVQHPKVLISAVDKSTTQLRLRFFNNVFHDEYSKQPIWQVARYTMAVPMYFTECDNYVDGGILANNPCESGLMRIEPFYQERGRRLPIACVVSVGSGICPAEKFWSASTPISVQMLGVMHTGHRTQNFFTLLANALAESETVAEKCRRVYDKQGTPFFRFSPHFDEPIGYIETDSLKLISMIIKAKICTNEDQQMHKLVSLLCSRNLSQPH